jgi:hypothetical protein
MKLIEILFKFLNRLPKSGVTLLLSEIRITLLFGLSQGFFVKQSNGSTVSQPLELRVEANGIKIIAFNTKAFRQLVKL